MNARLGMFKKAVQSTLVVLSLGIAVGACDRGQEDASLQTIYDRNWLSSAGRTIGPVQNSAGMRTLIDCPTFQKYEQAMQGAWNGSSDGVAATVNGVAGCGFLLSNVRGAQYFSGNGIQAFAESCGTSFGNKAPLYRTNDDIERGRQVVRNAFASVDFGYTNGYTVDELATGLQICWSEFDQVSR